MNLGLRDATGLGRELAEHIRKKEGGESQESGEDITALETYAAARRTRGLDVIKLTKILLGTVGFMTQPRWFRWPIWVVWVLSYIPLFKRQVVYRLSGLENR